MNTILLATDGSEHAVRAAAFAGLLSAASGSTVDVVYVVPERHVIPGAVVDDYARSEHAYVTERDLLEAAGRHILNESAAGVTGAGGRVGTRHVLTGSAAREIADYADRNHCDVIVMGRRGLGDLKGLLMGSVSHRVGHLTDKTLVTTE